MEEKTYLRGNNLITEDDECDCIIFILKGKVGISMEKSCFDVIKQVDILSTGDYIGQWSILHSSKYQFNAKAINDVKVFKLQRSFFLEFSNVLDDLVNLWHNALAMPKVSLH